MARERKDYLMPGRAASKYYARKIGSKEDKRISLGNKTASIVLAYKPMKNDEIEDVKLGLIFRERNGNPELLIINSNLPLNTMVSVVHGKTVTPIATLEGKEEVTLIEGKEYLVGSDLSV
jgi:hypothetical protein